MEARVEASNVSMEEAVAVGVSRKESKCILRMEIALWFVI
jgi:hypothetical protein